MLFILAIVIGTLFGAGIYLLLRRGIVKLILGLAMLGYAANLLIFAVGGRLQRVDPPIIPEGMNMLIPPYADPLPQALVLTAIVIGFAIQAFALVLIKVSYQTVGTDDLDAMTSTDR